MALVEVSCKALSTSLCCVYWSRAHFMDTRSADGWRNYRKIGFPSMRVPSIHAFTGWKRRVGFVLKLAAPKTTERPGSIPSLTPAWRDLMLSKKDGSSSSVPSDEF